jgi:hypothetical protein
MQQPASQADVGEHDAREADEPRPEESRWGLREGEEIAPGRTAIKLLGGGFRYEA